MSNIEKIRQEIERMLTFDGSIATSYYIGKRDAERELKSFIDSLPEEKPSEDLKEEVKRYYSDNFTYISSDQPTLSILTNVARHFAEWQKEQMMKDAVEGFIICYNDDTYAVESCCRDNKEHHHHSGDKVRIIIVKED